MDQPPSRLHVFIIDGTLSRLHAGHESNAGLLYKLLQDRSVPRVSQTIGYDPGIQGDGWRKWVNVASGMTINTSIAAGYAALCSRYREGDRIMLFGYSRGAYAVRSLAGMIGSIGLLRRQHATERRVRRAFRYYEAATLSPQGRLFSERYCRTGVKIDCVGVWDTVRALGLPYPVLSRLAPMATDFHDHKLGPNVRNAFQALALDETRTAYAPLPWRRQTDWPGRLEQCWFPGTHADVGGQVWRRPAARGLSNLSLIWMLERAEECGMMLPPDWRTRFEADPGAPSMGLFRGAARYFVIRAARVAGRCPSENLHFSVGARQDLVPRYTPKARWVTRVKTFP